MIICMTLHCRYAVTLPCFWLHSLMVRLHIHNRGSVYLDGMGHGPHSLWLSLYVCVWSVRPSSPLRLPHLKCLLCYVMTVLNRSNVLVPLLAKTVIQLLVAVSINARACLQIEGIHC